MSDVDPRTDEIVLGIDDALALGTANHHLRFERDERGGGIGRTDGNAAVGAQNGMFAVDGAGRIGKAECCRPRDSGGIHCGNTSSAGNPAEIFPPMVPWLRI